MKKITITVDVDGNAVSREYIYDATLPEGAWESRIEDMLDTIEKSEVIEF